MGMGTEWSAFDRAITLALAACAVAAHGCEREPEKRKRARLTALPYLAATPVAEADLGKRGVTVHDPERTAPGINVYCSEKHRWFELRSMTGDTLRRVDLPGWCKLVEPYRSGFLALHGIPERNVVEALSRLDWDGAPRWTHDGHLHHDFDVVDGTIYVLDTATGRIEHEDGTFRFLDNGLTIVDADTGATLGRRSLRPALLEHVSRERLAEIARNPVRARLRGQLDLFHVNTVEVLRADSPLGEAGDVLLAARHLDLIGVLDLDTDALGWVWTGELEGPHQPQVVDDGRVLVFDNGRHRGWSRLVELDPGEGSIAWSYADRDEPFFSETRGSVQPLPNGNLLVAESDRGRWFELTRAGETVWEYWTEDSADESTDGRFMRNTTYRTQRLFEDAIAHPGYAGLWAEAVARTD